MADIPAVFEATAGYRARVGAFAAWLGLSVRWDLLLVPGGHAYRGGVVAALCDALRPWMALHDVAHWLVAPTWRKRRTNFGLGAAPQVHRREAPSRVLVSTRHARAEETAAAVLTIFLAWDLLDGDAAESATLGHDGMRGYDASENRFTEAGYERWEAVLRKRGLIDGENRSPLVARFRSEARESGGTCR
ncbi:MAG: hypothetical protein Q7V43_06675 [Myxococcales bacterium]|nr:hypothetical protein [Myxococcales bacterium]